ncbi:MAG: zinc ribbon domain-containing protein [Gaiellaceae bacterium]
MSFPLAICIPCGRAVFPPRALCPACGASSWVGGAASEGVAEQVTERAGVRIASVRTDLGPVLIARVAGDVVPGETIALDDAAGVPVARPT